MTAVPWRRVPADPRHRRTWEYPDCPLCSSDVGVWRPGPLGNQYARVPAYECEGCGVRFSSPVWERMEGA